MHTVLTIERNPRPDLSALIAHLDTLDALGARTDKLPAVKAARKRHLRWQEIKAQAAADRGSSNQITAQAARDYADGTISTEELRAAAVAATIAADRTSPLYSMYTSALDRLSAQARSDLAALGDAWVTDIMRPLVNALVTAIMADIPAGMAERVYPRDHVSRDMLLGRTDAQLNHGRLRQVHAVANTFRRLQIIPATVRDTSAWEWATSMGERGNTDDTLEHFVYLQHRGHQAGIFTDTEAADAEAANPTAALTTAEAYAQRARATALAATEYR